MIAQLEVLQLSGGGIDLGAIRDHAPRLAYLRALRLHGDDAAALAGYGLRIEHI